MEVDGFFADFPDFNRVIQRGELSQPQFSGGNYHLDKIENFLFPREDSPISCLPNLVKNFITNKHLSLEGRWIRNSWGAYVVGADPLSDIAVLQVKDEASVRDPAKWHEMKVWCHVDWVGLGFFVQQIVHVQSLWTNPWAPQIAFYIILPFPFCLYMIQFQVCCKQRVKTHNNPEVLRGLAFVFLSKGIGITSELFDKNGISTSLRVKL